MPVNHSACPGAGVQSDGKIRMNPVGFAVTCGAWGFGKRKDVFIRFVGTETLNECSDAVTQEFKHRLRLHPHQVFLAYLISNLR